MSNVRSFDRWATFWMRNHPNDGRPNSSKRGCKHLMSPIAFRNLGNWVTKSPLQRALISICESRCTFFMRMKLIIECVAVQRSPFFVEMERFRLRACGMFSVSMVCFLTEKSSRREVCGSQMAVRGDATNELRRLVFLGEIKAVHLLLHVITQSSWNSHL